jgi:hypothetical protein
MYELSEPFQGINYTGPGAPGEVNIYSINPIRTM